MKKPIIIFSFMLCCSFLNSCNSDRDNTYNKENTSHEDAPAEDSMASPMQEDHTAVDSTNGQSSNAKENQPDTYTEDQTTTSSRDGNSMKDNNRTTANSGTTHHKK